MSNPTLLHLPLRANLSGRDRAGVVTATASGPVRHDASLGYYAEEATTNLLPNPSGETNTTGWGGATVGVSATRVTTEAYVGSASVRMLGDGVNVPSIVQPISGGAANGEAWSIQARIKGPAGSTCRLRFRIVDGASATIRYVEGSTVTCDGTWQYHSLTHTIADAAAAAVQLYVLGNNASDPYYIDACQAEKKAYVTSYCDGSLGTGYSWSGTAHGSTSSRAAAYLTTTLTNHIDFATGTIVVRINRAVDAGQNQYIAAAGNNGVTQWMGLYVAGSLDDYTRFALRADAGTSYADAGTGVITAGASKVIGGMWDLTTVTALEDGLTAGATPAARTYAAGTAWSNSIFIGALTSTLQLNGYISDLIICDRPLSAQERSLLASRSSWDFETLKPARRTGQLRPI